MNRKTWIRKTLSMCLAVAITATYSMVALANTEKIAGELIVSGKTINGQNPFVKINGETAQSGRSIFSNSTIATPDNANAIINLGKIGKIELAPNTIMTVSFNDNGINGDLASGQVTVLSTSDSVTVKTADGKTTQLHSGESAGAADDKSAKDDDDDHHGNSLALFLLIFGGAIAGILIAALKSNNKISIGGNTTVVSTIR